MKTEYCILADMAAQHRRRAEELEIASLKSWLRREVQPQLDAMWDQAIAAMWRTEHLPAQKISREI